MEGNHFIGYVILKDGVIVAEDYRNDSYVDELYPIFSITKSVSTMIVGLLVDGGQLDLSSNLGEIFNDEDVWIDIVDASEKQTLTVQELLTMTSGLSERFEAQESFAIQTSLPNVLNATTFHEEQWGTYQYLPFNHILAHVIQQASGGKTPLEVATEAGLMDALGFHLNIDYTWETYGTVEGTAFGLNMNPRSLTKFGQFYLQEGLAAPNLPVPIISPQWIASSTSNQLPAGEVPGTVSLLYKGYGYQWYTDIDGDDTNNKSAFAAIGNGGQYLAVFPNENIVVSIMASFDIDTVDQAIAESSVLLLIARIGFEAIDQGGPCVDLGTEEEPVMSTGFVIYFLLLVLVYAAATLSDAS